MSLIDEALKRAREQAERESATRRSAASRWVPADPLARKRSRALLWVGLAAGCLLFGVGAGLVASRFSGGREGGERGLAIAEEPAADGGADLSPAAGAVLLEETTETTDLSTEPPFPLPGELPPGEPLGPVPLPGLEPPPAEVDEVPVEPPQAAPEQPVPPPPTPPPDPAPPAASEPAPAAGASHVRRAPVPGGGAIELGGIAFSANQPVALLNGRVVGVGEVVEGFTVIAIEPRRVELRGHGTTVFLTLD